MKADRDIFRDAEGALWGPDCPAGQCILNAGCEVTADWLAEHGCKFEADTIVLPRDQVEVKKK